MDDGTVDLPRSSRVPDAIDLAIDRGIRNAVREHALLGRSVPEMRGGKVVWVSPTEILAMLDSDDSADDNDDDD